MKKKFLALSLAVLTLASCTKEKEKGKEVEPIETYIDASSKTTWNYYSLTENKLIGTGTENDTSNASWFARKDWDFAINRYSIRTNSGAASSVNSQGGVHTFDASITFNSISTLPSGAQFVVDKAITSEGMGGTTTTTIRSTATVILFKTNEDGSSIMPPVYLQAPVYIFRTADNSKYYKIQFTQYQNENKVTGHVKFYSAQIK